ncbi:MAG: glucose-6-phosphate isomerase [bacterium]|nr:glucose-6-phosphate isomerase [bacterium]
MKYELGSYSGIIEEKIDQLESERIIERIWEKDFTLWGNSLEEISNRLGWLDCLKVTRKSFPEIKSFVDEVRNEGFTNALLMGMGGSSLAPEVFRLTFGVEKGFLDLHVLDSTHPEAILEYEKKLDPNKTLYIVSTKSGGTVETMSFMKYFFTSISKKLGKESASKHFIAITDPGSGLEETAKKLNFRKIFLNDPDIGGRFSALSLFGIVPAALIGVDIEKLFNEASKMESESILISVEKNSGVMLGVILGSLAASGVDKVTFITSPKIQYLGGWLEQLIAESTGKNGKGILPVDLEPSVSVNQYSKDRIFVYIRLSGDNSFDENVSQIKSAGFPLIEIEMKNVYQLGSEFFRWEFATAVAGYIMSVQPFDQPNVESAKVIARNMVKQFQLKGKLPELSTGNNDNNLSSFLSDLKSGKNYVTIQAYLKPDDKTWQQLQQLRLKILQKYKVATTLGYGPRFLHSTGQLHKGDGGNGFFIQFISEIGKDVPIQDEAGKDESSISFGTLIKAQALGDRQALIDNNRKVLSIDLGKDVIDSLSKLTV